MTLAVKLTVMAHCASTWAMVGLIWFVQIVHYPLFGVINRHDFPAYERFHQRLTTWVVAPLMFVELATAGTLLFWRPSSTPASLPIVGFVLLAIIWISTAFVQVPLHAVLANGFDEPAHRRLVLSNWGRTVAWTFRGLVSLALVDYL